MKSKLFSPFWRVAIALVLVLSMGLMAAPVSAAVSQPEVTVAPTTPADATAVYTIEFTTTEDLAIGDGIVIEFPATGGTDISAIVDADVTVTPGSFTEVVAIVGQRLSITLDVALEAGDITVVVGSTQFVTNPVDGDYTLDVYTSQEPTAVTSETYMISLALVSVAVAVLSPDTVATQADYEITLSPSADMRASDEIVVEFPVDTDISAVVKEDVTVNGTDPDYAVDHIHIDGQVLTITLGGALIAASTVVTVANHIINPTTVDNPDPLEGDTTEWKLTVFTSYLDRIPTVSNAYDLNAVTVGTDVSQIHWSTVDEYVSNDTVSTVSFVIETQDQYGNPAKVDGSAVTFDLTASSGAFYSESACTNVITTIDIDASASDSSNHDLYYKGATAGTVTITADEVVSQGWTMAEDTILVNPMLELWGGGAWRADYSTFADAITAALPYDTIKVAPSTYGVDSAINVNVAHLTIVSISDAATTILDSTNLADDGHVLDITADGVTIDGLKFLDPAGSAGFTTPFDSVTAFDVCNSRGLDAIDPNSTSDGVIQNCIFDGYDEQIPGASTDWTINDNDFLNGTYGIRTESAFTPEIKDNTFTQIGTGIFVYSADAIITDNTFTDCGKAITMCADVDGVTITGNTITDSWAEAGICIWVEANGLADLTISENTITGSTNDGILINATSLGTGNVIQYNDISGNGQYGINNPGGQSVDCKYNWWGDVTGPSADPDPTDLDADPTAYGAGDPISALVTYDPWLAVSQSVAVPATSSRYAIEIRLTHVASYSAGTWSGGWNTFSTPISLHGDGDTWEDITTMVDLQYAMVYGWDGTDWIAPFPSTTVITPLDAIFVQMKEEASLPILFSTQLLPAATKDLSAGWNLIGPASLDVMYRDAALASLGTGDTAKYSQVIDPISGAIITGTGETEAEMYPGMGYWIFMKEAGTLAGFSVTPQPWLD